MDQLLQFAKHSLESQPFSRLLGAEIEHIDGTDVAIRLPLRDELKQQHGFAHGGVLSYLADNALTFAGGMALGPAVLTAEFKINYVRPAVGTALVARAAVIHAGRSQAVCRCDVFARDAGSEKLVATAQGTISKVESLKRE
ncbi:MAG TPA: PaaI family thioesterase [Noviherbaspirillum sp.]|uniref:PaaI family thioesterase n=1 Tax=Noviherbaspirillum sp. TaxID=1926288 RepID=UPI002B46EBC5|nr:PaaI family thioesterase [Noviherbaspirillum sp.]HJV86289.1 PaaI family thioesterase [Noviherbaspirillum sp.]